MGRSGTASARPEAASLTPERARHPRRRSSGNRAPVLMGGSRDLAGRRPRDSREPSCSAQRTVEDVAPDEFAVLEAPSGVSEAEFLQHAVRGVALRERMGDHFLTCSSAKASATMAPAAAVARPRPRRPSAISYPISTTPSSGAPLKPPQPTNSSGSAGRKNRAPRWRSRRRGEGVTCRSKGLPRSPSRARRRGPARARASSLMTAASSSSTAAGTRRITVATGARYGLAATG